MLECKARSNPVSWTIIVSQKGDFYETENTKISACHPCTGVIPVPYYRLLTFSKFCTESRQKYLSGNHCRRSRIMKRNTRNCREDIAEETLIKPNSPRSNPHTHAAEFDTLRFNQRVLFDDVAVRRILTNPVYCAVDDVSIAFFQERKCEVVATKEEIGDVGFMPYNRTNQLRAPQPMDKWLVSARSIKHNCLGQCTGKRFF